MNDLRHDLDHETARRAGGAERSRSFSYTPDILPGLLVVSELALILVVGIVLTFRVEFFREEYVNQHLFCVVFVALGYLALARWAVLNTVNALMRPISVADNVVISVATAFLFLLTIIYGLDVYYMFDAIWIGLFFAIVSMGLLALRIGLFQVVRILSRRGVVGRNLAVLGAGEQSSRFLRKISRDTPYFTRVIGVFSSSPEASPDEREGYPVLGAIDELLAHAREGLIDDVVVAMPWSQDRTVIQTIEKLKELPVNVLLGSDLVGFDLQFRPVLGAFSQLPVFEVVQRPIAGWNWALKTLLDYALALIALILLAPLFLIVAAAIKLDSPGPVFFMQKRLGFNNKPFAIYKFRSMRADADKHPVVVQATRNDPRVTRVGRVIRATSIDELPQLLNVLDGTMSLVGPRPHALSHNEEYGAQIRGYFARHKVKPGITGWAQVNGLRGETADLETMRKRVEHDVYYAENWSLFLDIKIIILTALVVLFQKQAY